MQTCKNFFSKNRGFALLLAAELALVLILFALAMRVQAPVVLTGADLVANIESAFLDENGGMAVQDSEEYGAYASTPTISLKKGSYKVTVEYQSSLEGGKVRQSNPYVTCNELVLDVHANAVSFSLWARGDTATCFEFTNNGGYRSISRVTVAPTRAWARVSTLEWLVLFALADLLILLRKGRTPLNRWDYSTRLVWATLGCVVFFACLPLCTGYTLPGHDLTFHLSRIQGIADGIASGQFPVKIYPSLLQGNGYANGVFYGDLFLYFPAVLRLLGFSIQASYKLYLAAVNLATVMVSFWCFEKMFASRMSAVLGSALYTLSIYRLTNVYIRASVGEYTAMVFLPLILYALWKIFSQEPDAPGYKSSWIPGVIGYSGLICSHILSCELAAIFTVITCLVFVKKVFRPASFIALAKIVIYTTLICLWFLVPFADYMLTGSFLINTPPSTIWSSLDYSTFTAQIFMVFASGGGITNYLSQGMKGEMPLAVGPALTLGALVFLLLMLDPAREKNRVSRLGGFCIGLGTLAVFMTTDLFPWYEISEICPLFWMLIAKLQFPWRFLALASLFLAVTVAAAFYLLRKKNEKLFLAGSSVLFAVMFLCTGMYYYNVLQNSGAEHYYDLSDMTSSFGYTDYGYLNAQVAGAEYLPTGVDQDTIWEMTTPRYNAELVTVDSYARSGLTCRVQAQNTDAAAQPFTLPLLLYKGYQAADDATGEALAVEADENGQLCVILPAGYAGGFTVQFVEPWYWRVAEAVSALSLVGFAAVALLRRRKVAVPV